jgi:thiamine pyrophosphate-dependent acetolactate synthase large subunit-like protein
MGYPMAYRRTDRVVARLAARQGSILGAARAFGGFGVTVEKTADIPAAFKAAEASGQPAIIHLKIDAEAITPTTTLARIRESAFAGRHG